MSLWDNKNWTPMLLKEVDKPFDSKDYIYELKYDGIRAIIYVSPNSFEIRNRHNEDITKLYPELKEIQKLVKRKTIFDGEIIFMENGKPSFEKLQKRAHLKNKDKIKYNSFNNPVIFVAFDILYDNKDLIDMPLIKRKKIIDKYLENNYFLKTKWILNNGVKLFESVKKLDLEGIVAKEKNSTYKLNSRSSSWLKIKNIKSEYFYIGGYIEKDNSFTISLILGEYRNGLFCYVGKVSLGKKQELYKKIKKEKLIRNSPFIDFNENVNYIKPTIKCKVNFLERTDSNSLRQPFIS